MSRRRRPALWPLAVLTALLIGVPVVAGIVDLVESDDEGSALQITNAPERYRIVYRVEDRVGDAITVTTEHLSVRRPFDGHVEVRRGEPPGDEVLSVRVSVFAGRERRGRDSEPLRLTVEPSPPDGDLRLDAVLTDVLGAGVLERLGERREILGRRCELFRTDLSDTGDHGNLCIDEAGLVLVEERVLDGEVARRRVAVDVDLDPDLDDELFAPESERADPDLGGGGITRVTSDSREPGEISYELVEGPAGFESRGRYAIVPAHAPPEAAVLVPGERTVGVVTVWTRGPDLVAVFNGDVEGAENPFGSDPDAQTVDVGLPVRAQLVVELTGSEVRADLGRGRFVRVFGTLPAAELIEFARSLLPFEDGEIVTLE